MTRSHGRHPETSFPEGRPARDRGHGGSARRPWRNKPVSWLAVVVPLINTIESISSSVA